MSAFTNASPIHSFAKEHDLDDLQSAIELLIEEYAHEPGMEHFLETYNLCDGDVTQMLSKTHEPVLLREFVESDYFLNLRIIDNEDESVKKNYGGGLWGPVFEACENIVKGGYIENLFVGAIGCVDRDTEYLTPHGWKPIGEYKRDMVAYYDPETGRHAFAFPNAFVKRECPSGFLHFKTPEGLDQMLSDGHRVYYTENGHEWLIDSASNIAAKHNSGKWFGLLPSYDVNTRLITMETLGPEIERVSSPDGYMYCFNVDTGLLVLRRNGKVFITGNTGKTSAAQVVTAYNLYRLSCETSPHMRFNIIPKNDIYYVMLNVTDELAQKVTFKGFRGLIENSPYFNEVFPYDKNVSSELRFPKKIVVAAYAAFAKKLMGMDIMGGIVDEMNFMQQVKKSKRARDNGEFKQATSIYNSLVRRLKSRFDTDDIDAPICLSLVSSKNYSGDFTETRQLEAERENMEAEAHGNRPLTYIYDKAQWEAKPDAKFKKGTPFFVEVGEGRYPTRILREGDIPREKAIVKEVPEYFKNDFLRDPDGALADFVGINSGSSDALFYDKLLVWNMNDKWLELGYKNPFLDDDVRSDHGWPRVNPDYEVPNPDRPRACHIDLALSGDAVGIAVGHVHKVSHGSVIDRMTGKKTIEAFPHVAYDQVLIVRPPRAGQIELAEIRAIIYFLRDVMKIPIRWVTYDGFQSADSRQILRKSGFKTDYVSVENIATYGPFRTAMFFHKRISCAEHERVFGEIIAVAEDPMTGKVDHRGGGSKDGSDAMVGVFTMLMKTPSSWNPDLLDEEDADDAPHVKDRLSDREKEVLGEWAEKEAPPGSIADRIKSKRRSITNRREIRKVVRKTTRG